MKKSAFTALSAAFSLALLATACMNDSGGEGKPPTGGNDAQGTFLVTVVPPTLNPTGYTTLSGNIYDGPVPTVTSYQDDKVAGDCALKVAKRPQCGNGCGSGFICVADNKCQEESNLVGVGTVTLTGFKAEGGGAAVVNAKPTDPAQKNFNYQLPAEPKLAYPPFAPGDPVTLTAAGDTGVGPFTVSGKGIAPLSAPADTLLLADGQPLKLAWTPSTVAGTRMLVEVNITNHGGHQGKISCETDDDGSLEVAASLVDGLKKLGVSGFPTAELTRQSRGTSPDIEVDLVFESKVIRDLTIPGIVSCTVDEDCPSGKTCSENTMVCE